MPNNAIQIFQTEPDELTLSVVDDDDRYLSVPLSAHDVETLILSLTINLASMRGYTPDMFYKPIDKKNRQRKPTFFR